MNSLPAVFRSSACRPSQIGPRAFLCREISLVKASLIRVWSSIRYSGPRPDCSTSLIQRVWGVASTGLLSAIFLQGLLVIALSHIVKKTYCSYARRSPRNVAATPSAHLNPTFLEMYSSRPRTQEACATADEVALVNCGTPCSTITASDVIRSNTAVPAKKRGHTAL